MTNVLIVGQAPGRSPGVVLGGRCGARLATMAGISLDEFLASTDRINLFDWWPGHATAGGDRFPMAEARRRAFAMVNAIASHHRTVLLGSGVARAFRVRVELFEWVDVFRDQGSLVAIAPHPSGVSRWWNSPENVARARSFWRETFQR